MQTRLIAAAKHAAENAYAPYSKIKVGAAILCADGTIFTGCNVENSSYGASICAERSAAAKAVSEGRRDFTAIAVVSNLPGFTYPCGICRQFLSEFNPQMRVILQDQTGQITEKGLEEIFANSFLLNK